MSSKTESRPAIGSWGTPDGKEPLILFCSVEEADQSWRDRNRGQAVIQDACRGWLRQGKEKWDETLTKAAMGLEPEEE